MKNRQTQQNHVKKISIIHINNTENNPEMLKYSNNKRNTLTKTINNNRNNNTLKQYNTINDINRIPKVYRPKTKSNSDNFNNNNNYINKREINSNKNNQGKLHLIRKSEGQLPSYYYITSNNINNKSKKTIDLHQQSNSNYHEINQIKKNHRTQQNSRDKKPIYTNHSTIFISSSSRHSKEKIRNITKNVNINKIVKNMPKLNLAKLKEISKDYTKKPQTSRTILTNNKIEQIKNIKKQNHIQNIEKEENKVKFSRRLEITEKTEVLLPNQTFKPYEQFENKEKPIIEIKKNKDGTNLKIIKEILIKTTIENSLIDVPKINIVKNAPQVTLIKQKITKEYITTIKFYSNIIDFDENTNIINSNININNNNNNININNKSENQRKKNNSNHELIEIKPEKPVNAKNGQNLINHEKEIKINNEPLTDRGTNGFEKNNIYKSLINEKNKRNIKNTVYSNVINNNIIKPHKRNSNSKKNAKIDNMIRKNIQNKNFHTIGNIHRKNKYSGNIGINTNLNINQNQDGNLMDNNNNINEISSINKNINNISKDKLKFLTSKEFNNLQGLSNESQLLSNIMNVNGSVNSFSISESKYSSKNLFDIPFNLDLEKNESEKLEEKEKIIFSEKEKDKKEENEKNEQNEEKKVINNSENKYEKLNEFIIKFNDEKEKPDSNINNPNGEKTEKGKSKLIENQNEEKILNQMQLSNINLTLKEFEENENDDNNAYYGENTNNFDKRDLTGSIMFINSNIDKNIHIQNGLENYSINMDGNSITDNFNIIEGGNLLTKNDKEFIDKQENIKNEIKAENKMEDIIPDNNLDEKEEEIENEIEDENKFYSPLNKYENKFNLDQINPF